MVVLILDLIFVLILDLIFVLILDLIFVPPLSGKFAEPLFCLCFFSVCLFFLYALRSRDIKMQWRLVQSFSPPLPFLAHFFFSRSSFGRAFLFHVLFLFSHSSFSPALPFLTPLLPLCIATSPLPPPPSPAARRQLDGSSMAARRQLDGSSKAAQQELDGNSRGTIRQLRRLFSVSTTGG